MKAFLDSKIKSKRVLILGMGAEGKSTYKLLRRLYPEQIITLADRRENLINDADLKHNATFLKLGNNYLEDLDSYDLIIKSPGISNSALPTSLPPEKLTSQTELFLTYYRDRTIGITGTKGKSTTASLIHHLLLSAGKDALLIGNIGLPPFDVLDKINNKTMIVFELSSHQLEGIRVSPHIAVLLNIYQEHLDHYPDFRAYQLAKFNITRWQKPGDYFIYYQRDELIKALVNEIKPESMLLPFDMTQVSGSKTLIIDNQLFTNISEVLEKLCDLNDLTFLPGKHNLLNQIAALLACHAAGIHSKRFCEALKSFKSLEHRMEFVGEFDGKRFFNDSIATIPEAVIFALETIGDVDTLILGGYDRGIDYKSLVSYLSQASLRNIFLTGNAGKRIMEQLLALNHFSSKLEWFEDFDQMVNAAIHVTPRGHSCLLSPAAASYDRFLNFEHRGNRFKELIRESFSAEKGV